MQKKTRDLQRNNDNDMDFCTGFSLKWTYLSGIIFLFSDALSRFCLYVIYIEKKSMKNYLNNFHWIIKQMYHFTPTFRSFMVINFKLIHKTHWIS